MALAGTGRDARSDISLIGARYWRYCATVRPGARSAQRGNSAWTRDGTKGAEGKKDSGPAVIAFNGLLLLLTLT